MNDAQIQIEPLETPEFLQLGVVRMAGEAFEIASRRKLDTRAIVPFFEQDGELQVGICERERAARALMESPLRGWEAFSYDFRGADETSDIATLGEGIFAERTGLVVDSARAPIALPSFARSVGYLCELCLPLLLPIAPPGREVIELKEPKGARMIFLPLREALARLDQAGSAPHAEELEVMLRALQPPRRAKQADPHADPAHEKVSQASEDALLARHRDRLATAEQLQPKAPGAGETSAAAPEWSRESRATAMGLRFLRLSKITTDGAISEVVTPASGVSFALLPFVRTARGLHFLLWDELRPSALERQARAPLFDLPVSLRHVNATGFFLAPDQAARVKKAETDQLESLAPALLARALGAAIPTRAYHLLTRCAPAPATSSELRVSAAIELDPVALAEIALPVDARLISASELSRAIGEGRVRDPVVVHGFLRLAEILAPEIAPLDPFADAREGEPAARRQFLSAMTHGSEVQRRLLGYSSIEAEQLAAPTYARLMTLLQHEHGLRIAYPKTEADRSFFKAAFRVFMAADRGDDDRALQGLHWSHDAFHFALGNFIVPAPPDFARWYASGAEAPPEQKPEGPAWEIYSRALKTAENEATFFSFWTLYDENLALARHVGKLTYYEALRDLGITDRKTAREIYDDVVDRAVLPERVRASPVYQARADIRGLFDYMRGFRAYHFKDIAVAWGYATRDPYRGYLARFSIYEHDLDKYVAHVRGFMARLEAMPRGLNPLLCALAEARLDLALRVWDVTKALRLLRAGTLSKAPPQAGEGTRAFLLIQAEPFLQRLEALQRELSTLRGEVQDAELTPRNQATLARIADAAKRVEAVRKDLWDWVEQTGLVAPEKVLSERVRELPR